jgi:hypothetical protein
MPTIILNSTNIVNSGNNKLVYRFQGGGVNFKNNDIALAQMSIYYSWFNINKRLYKNQTFQYIWVDGTTYTITIPDGYYDSSSLQNFFESQMVLNKTYLVNTTSGEFVFYFQFQENATFYAIQLNCFLIPSSLGGTLAFPSGATWSLPATAKTAQVVILPYTTSTFGQLIGFTPATYPATPSATTFSALSNTTPQIQPVSSILVNCSLINNPYSSPSQLLYSFGIPSTQFGQQILITPPAFTFNAIADGYYNEFQLEILDQNLIPIELKDPQMTILLTIRNRINN